MKTLTRMSRLVNFRSSAERRQVDERQRRPARLYLILAVILALSSSLVHAQTPTCVAPGCNSVQSDNAFNTAIGTGTLANLNGGSANTAAGYYAPYRNTTGSDNNSPAARGRTAGVMSQ
jgi:hypothetical protein